MDTKKDKLGFIGAGNMATALIKGLIQSGLYDKDHLIASDSEKMALEKISGQFGVRPYASNAELARKSSTLIFSVKPQSIREVLEDIKDEIRDDHLVISIAAGIPLKIIHSIIGRNIPMIRVMPNTPALIQKGMSALAAGKFTTSGHMKIAIGIFEAVG
ncbi:MAG: NAD(P)-binding domain-containing protein, partial [Thermodesulfobacteriota bacterium]|nr:NAD(P)-binding domain-containing protein [Thermodesulfobacteriota bacterium]